MEATCCAHPHRDETSAAPLLQPVLGSEHSQLTGGEGGSGSSGGEGGGAMSGRKGGGGGGAMSHGHTRRFRGCESAHQKADEEDLG